MEFRRSPAGSWLSIAARVGLMLAAITLQSAYASDPAENLATHDYQLGRGWQVPHTDLTLGGYATTQLAKLDDTPLSFDVTHLSAFLWWQPIQRLRFFTELDEQDALQVQSDKFTTANGYLAVERLYADWAQSDALNLRLGKFLTPIGRWNLIHADPLVWTTSRPLITQVTFPTNATGAMLFGTLNGIGSGLDYSIYSSIGAELRRDPKQDPFTEAYGLHLAYSLRPTLQLGFSYANFEQRSDLGNRRNLVGADVFWSHNGYEISAEAAYRFSSQGPESDELGGFVQGVVPLVGKLYGIGRYEYYDRAGPTSGVSLWLAGLDYRWSRAVIVKAEFSQGVHNRIDVPEGFLLSFAVLF
jgi:hypothetical protein